ncbi:hypothetical protein L1887_48564 [Cichorium endivia]|nr:hypothetical protein L1887_48564 [Cichorium endivia]
MQPDVARRTRHSGVLHCVHLQSKRKSWARGDDESAAAYVKCGPRGRCLQSRLTDRDLAWHRYQCDPTSVLTYDLHRAGISSNPRAHQKPKLGVNERSVMAATQMRYQTLFAIRPRCSRASFKRDWVAGATMQRLTRV